MIIVSALLKTKNQARKSYILFTTFLSEFIPSSGFQTSISYFWKTNLKFIRPFSFHTRCASFRKQTNNMPRRHTTSVSEKFQLINDPILAFAIFKQQNL